MCSDDNWLNKSFEDHTRPALAIMNVDCTHDSPCSARALSKTLTVIIKSKSQRPNLGIHSAHVEQAILTLRSAAILAIEPTVERDEKAL